MPMLTLLFVLVVIGVVTWAVTTYIPMSPGIARVIQIVAVVIAVIYALSAFGVFAHLGGPRVPTVR